MANSVSGLMIRFRMLQSASKGTNKSLVPRTSWVIRVLTSESCYFSPYLFSAISAIYVRMFFGECHIIQTLADVIAELKMQVKSFVFPKAVSPEIAFTKTPAVAWGIDMLSSISCIAEICPSFIRCNGLPPPSFTSGNE
jgi:hypothetical protein